MLDTISWQLFFILPPLSFQGSPGDPGAAGLPGEPGPPVSENFITVHVYSGRHSTNTNNVLFTLVQGQIGAPGPSGPQGPPGPAVS